MVASFAIAGNSTGINRRKCVPLGTKAGNGMSEQTQLQEWLSACQKQLRIYTRWRAATVAGAALLVITLVAAWVGFRSAYSAESMFLLRALLVLALAGAGVLLLWLPLKRINHHDGVD